MQVRSVSQLHLVVDVVFGPLVIHVPDGEDVDAGGDQRDHGEHHQGQAVDVVVDRESQVAETGQFVETAADVLGCRSVCGVWVCGVWVCGVWVCGVFDIELCDCLGRLMSLAVF